ncbi:hypothetical protein HanXRQr2_Chr03g0130171 [Helianthus annuus]|uniref:Uncharacterized protein n=1 Tax=Helianthus annuus TaxID=4232 RepID=A0A9K3JIU6_HELAN|nr:hypothetical protein HanXRQr2_Chr03g0130171 [Helianthus annuus]KAJ0594404.1 hypothetical protein HanHA300_Chr03g0108221 [Helianthus annuus]KAJ0602598.1 hypothetical protein HanIR_Chr03g0141521 [Helianthus annuus]KAJ0609457.1 hypothetical protein HanHA89_Chr03g0120231 [Helianthus annuus]KAJ0775236.1 hypothetical protein HanOQP8_Chr03g0120721 [Helianthus annuus]
MDFVKATLESDTRVLASEARRKHKTRGNTTSAGLFGSQAAKTIRTIDTTINCYFANFPLHKELSTGPTRIEFSHRLEKVGVTLSQWQRSCQPIMNWLNLTF